MCPIVPLSPLSYAHTMPCSSSVSSLCCDDEYILCGLESGLIEIFSRAAGFHRYRYFTCTVPSNATGKALEFEK